MGADVVIDYTTQDVVKVVKSVAVGGVAGVIVTTTSRRSYEQVRARATWRCIR